VLTLWLAAIPVILLFVLIAVALLRRFHRHRHAQHQELLNRLLNK
jgi:preprotein translocase subunit YajC